MTPAYTIVEVRDSFARYEVARGVTPELNVIGRCFRKRGCDLRSH